jgi:hypothetical protein
MLVVRLSLSKSDNFSISVTLRPRHVGASWAQSDSFFLKIRNQASGIWNSVSSIMQPVSGIWYLVSSIQHPESNIQSCDYITNLHNTCIKANYILSEHNFVSSFSKRSKSFERFARFFCCILIYSCYDAS